MKPVIVITDVFQENKEIQTREKTIALFGCIIYKRSEYCTVEKDKTIGFNSCDTNLTYVDDE